MLGRVRTGEDDWVNSSNMGSGSHLTMAVLTSVLQNLMKKLSGKAEKAPYMLRLMVLLSSQDVAYFSVSHRTAFMGFIDGRAHVLRLLSRPGEEAYRVGCHYSA
jgi:hypothetical protein